jgi:hypothetical protein
MLERHRVTTEQIQGTFRSTCLPTGTRQHGRAAVQGVYRCRAAAYRSLDYVDRTIRSQPSEDCNLLNGKVLSALAENLDSSVQCAPCAERSHCCSYPPFVSV